MNVLVTGAAGFIASTVCAQLSKQGHNVLATDAVSDNGTSELLDIRDYDALLALINKHAIDCIIHCAALLIPSCADNPRRGLDVNIAGSINVFEAARNSDVCKVVYASSIAARPAPQTGVPRTLYGISKACVEQIALYYGVEHGIASIGLRPAIVYGPNRTAGDTAVFSAAIRAALAGKPFELPASVNTSFEYIDDITQAFVCCAETDFDGAHSSDIGGSSSDVQEFIATVKRIVPQADIRCAKQAAISQRRSPALQNNDVLRALCPQWQESTLEQGIRETVATLQNAVSPTH